MEEQKEKIIYVVTEGKYSDKHYLMAFSTRDQAKSYIDYLDSKRTKNLLDGGFQFYFDTYNIEEIPFMENFKNLDLPIKVHYIPFRIENNFEIEIDTANSRFITMSKSDYDICNKISFNKNNGYIIRDKFDYTENDKKELIKIIADYITIHIAHMNVI